MSLSQTIPSLHKSIDVLKWISESREPVTVKELVYSLKIPQATCYRIVRTLLASDLLREDISGGYRMGVGVVKLARAYSEIEGALHRVRAPLQDLADVLSLSAKISLREREWAVTLLRAEPPSPNAITSPVGQRIHLAKGGSAAEVLLSALPDAEVEGILAGAPEDAWRRQTPADALARTRSFRKTGVAVNLGSQHPSIHAMSMGVRLTSSDATAVSVVGWPEDFREGNRKNIEQRLRESVAAMNRMCEEPAREAGG